VPLTYIGEAGMCREHHVAAIVLGQPTLDVSGSGGDRCFTCGRGQRGKGIGQSAAAATAKSSSVERHAAGNPGTLASAGLDQPSAGTSTSSPKAMSESRPAQMGRPVSASGTRASQAGPGAERSKCNPARRSRATCSAGAHQATASASLVLGRSRPMSQRTGYLPLAPVVTSSATQRRMEHTTRMSGSSMVTWR
jgi:hypothetical protein